MMRLFPACARLLLLIGVLGIPTGAAAQWQLEAQAGRLQYESAPEAASTSIAVGLGYSAPLTAFGATAGVPFSREEPFWGALYGFHRLRTGSVPFLGMDLGASAFAYRMDPPDSPTVPLVPSGPGATTGWGASLEAMPLVRWSSSELSAEARAGAVHFFSEGDGVEGFTRTAFQADAVLGSTPLPTLRMELEGALVAVGEGSYPYAGVHAVWAPGATLSGGVGAWFHDGSAELAWSAALSLPVADRLNILVNARHEPVDPLYATPERTTWGAGLRLWLGEPEPTIAEPVPDGYADGVATVAIDAQGVAGTPSIAGDLNDWTPTPMTRRGDRWVHSFHAAPGVYNYAFVDGDGEWFVPEDTPGRRDDGMGGHVAVLVIQ